MVQFAGSDVMMVRGLTVNFMDHKVATLVQETKEVVEAKLKL